MEALSSYVYGSRKLLYQLLSKHNTLQEIPSKEGKVAIVTGGNSGIGLETVKGLCKARAHVIMACRSEIAADQAIKILKEDNKDAIVDYIHLDLSSLKSVREFVAKFRQRRLPLHILINNAGVMHTPYGTTKDGFELQIGINHLGHFALTKLLLEDLKKSGTRESFSRIITLSSSVHSVGTINFEDLQSRESYSPHRSYNQSKLANVLFTYELQRRLTEGGSYVTANAVHPGIVNTDLFRHGPWFLRVPQSVLSYFLFKTPEQGAVTSLYAALSPELEASGGKYLSNCQEEKSSAESYKEDVQKKLWQVSCQLTAFNETVTGEVTDSIHIMSAPNYHKS